MCFSTEAYTCLDGVHSKLEKPHCICGSSFRSLFCCILPQQSDLLAAIHSWNDLYIDVQVSCCLCFFPVFRDFGSSWLRISAQLKLNGNAPLLFMCFMNCCCRFSDSVPTMADPPLIPEVNIEEAPKPKETPNPYQILKAKYDKMQSIMIRVQNGLDMVASCLEKVEALVTWKDPVASRILVAVLFIAAIAVKVFGIQILACCGVLWVLRPPCTRNSKPSPLVNLFTRVPTRGDQVL